MVEHIEPALTPEEWQEKVAWLWKGETVGPTVGLTRQGMVVIADDDYYAGFTHTIDRAPALIALANAALPDDDPRKITRAKLQRMIDAAKFADALDALDFAEALASYLPPDA